MQFGLIYRTTNTFNGKVYIGQTTRVSDFLNGHYLGSGEYLKLAIMKYGRSSFRTEILEYAENQEILNRLEIKYILENSSMWPVGYNLKEGGEAGGKCSEEVKEKLRRVKRTEETREKLRKAGLGRKASEITKAKMRSSQSRFNSKNKRKSPYEIWVETYGVEEAEIRKKKMSSKRSEAWRGERNPWYGKNLPEELKKKLSETMKGRLPPNRKRVQMEDLEGNVLAQYESVTEAISLSGVSSVSQVCQGKLKSTKGLVFRFLP